MASEQELKTVACVLHHCSAGFAPEDPEKHIYELLEKLGSNPEYSQLREQLSKEKFTISYTDPFSGLEITQSVSLFEYSKMDGLLDDASYADGKYQLSNRGLGALQAFGGAIDIIGGMVACSTPFTCAIGAAVATSGYDNLQAGSNTLSTGRQTKTMGAEALEAPGVPPEYSEIVYATATLGSTGTIVLRSAKTREIITTTVTAEGKVSREVGNGGLVTNSGKRTDGQIVRNSDGLYEVNINKTPLEAHERLNTPDLGGSGKLKPAEAASAAQLESVLGKMERYVPPSGVTSGTSPDFVIISGPNKGKTVDAMYTTDKLSQKEIDGLNKYYAKNMNIGSGKDVIQDHLKKADFVPVDFRVLTPANQKIFKDYIKTLPESQQDKIIIVR